MWFYKNWTPVLMDAWHERKSDQQKSWVIHVAASLSATVILKKSKITHYLLVFCLSLFRIINSAYNCAFNCTQHDHLWVKKKLSL